MSTLATEAQHTNFKEKTSIALANERLKVITDTSTRRKDDGRKRSLLELPDALAARELAARIKDHTLQNLDRYLEQFTDNVRNHGGQVHFAATGDQACEIIREIAQQTDSKLLVKSKSMATEEIELNHALEAAGLEVVETDLGEYILQLADEKPSHIVTPVAHMNREDVARHFHEKLGIEYTTDPPTLTAHARDILRDKFRNSDMGIIGCNFGVAETGTVTIVTNEGNGRYCASRPRVLVCLMGMEKLIPRMQDLPLFLKLLGKSASGMRITCYTSMTTGPKRADDFDGPEEFHLVIMDSSRSKILGSRYRSTLRCIRCGACLNACPVYRKIGGHAYEATYPGPIGKLITPLLKGIDEYENLPQASSLCGACLDACPVRIDIPSMLIEMRDDLRKGKRMPWWYRMGFTFWRMGMQSRFLYRTGSMMAHRFLDVGTQDGWHKKLPGMGAQWTNHRDFPAMADRPFHQRWDDLETELDRELNTPSDAEEEL